MMNNANIFLAQQRVLELRRQANEARQGRAVRRSRRARLLHDRAGYDV